MGAIIESSGLGSSSDQEQKINRDESLEKCYGIIEYSEACEMQPQQEERVARNDVNNLQKLRNKLDNIKELTNSNFDIKYVGNCLSEQQIYSVAAISLVIKKITQLKNMGEKDNTGRNNLYYAVQTSIIEVFSELDRGTDKQRASIAKSAEEIANRVEYALIKNQYSPFSKLCEYLREMVESMYEAMFGGISKNEVRKASGESSRSLAAKIIEEYNSGEGRGFTHKEDNKLENEVGHHKLT